MRPKSSIDLVIVGGFLGVGKTTTLSYLARILTRRGRKVGIVTNDQGRTLVDTKFQANLELPVVEVVGGCFCCRFDDLVTQADALISQYQVDIILAEPVGSCTDLVATVCKPLESKTPCGCENSSSLIQVIRRTCSTFSARSSKRQT